MTNQDALARLQEIGNLTHSTIYQDEVHARIAVVLTADEEGFYFFTLRQKPFNRQLAETGRVTISGEYLHPVDPHPTYKLRPGYTIRLIGKVREVSHDLVREKAKTNPDFQRLIDYDFVKYPNTVCYVLYEGKGDIFDYDFNLELRDKHKMIRTRWGFGGATYNPNGFRITDACIGCGECHAVCGYEAITPGTPYEITPTYCEECGACHNVCPAGAIEIPQVF